MWEAAQLPGGKQEWADIALQHSRTVTKELFRCRPSSATQLPVFLRCGLLQPAAAAGSACTWHTIPASTLLLNLLLHPLLRDLQARRQHIPRGPV